jgi:hypothetical protein
MFHGRKLIIATKHQKEKVIAPALEKALGVKCITIADLDTDKLGTFSGEVERKFDPITTAKNKCAMAMEINQCDLAIASEGSFGPHPTIYFIPADEEFLVLVDKKNMFEIIVRVLSTETNYNAAVIKTALELKNFAKAAGFPSHGLILRKAKNDYSIIEKGVIDKTHLANTFNSLISNHGSVYVETDMRAMYNPKRMKVIEQATQKLIAKINSKCPQCKTPGFDITKTKPGLPCSLCSNSTRVTLSNVYSCIKCNFSKEEKYPEGKLSADPMYCDYCNP